jgi:hypothetical protein
MANGSTTLQALFLFLSFVVPQIQLTPPGDACTVFTHASNLTWFGSISTAAPDGTPTYIKNPRGLAWDGETGLLIIAEFGFNRIRRVSTTTGNVSTIAGSPAGTAGSPPSNGLGPAATFNGPLAVSVNGSGWIFVADTVNNRIRLISPSVNATEAGSTFGWGWVTTFAGTGGTGWADGPKNIAMFNTPRGVAADSSGGVYVAEFTAHRLRYVSAAGLVSTLAGTPSGLSGFADGAPNVALLSSPQGLAFDAGVGAEPPLLAVADTSNYRVRLLAPATGALSTLAGSASGYAEGSGTAAQFAGPGAVAWVRTTPTQPRFLLVTDTNNNRVRAVYANGTTLLLAGGAAAGAVDGTGAVARFSQPTGIAVNASGAIFVSDSLTHLLRGMSCGFSGGAPPSTTASPSAGAFASPTSTATPSPSPSPTGTRGACTLSTLSGLPGVNSFVSSTAPALVRMGSQLAAASNGSTLLVVDAVFHSVYEVTAAGAMSRVSGLGTTVAGYADNRFGTSASFSSPTAALGGCAFAPAAVAPGMSGWGGVVLIADTGNARLRGILFNRTVVTVVGNGSATYADGNLAAAALLAPTALACGGDGATVYVADGYRLRALPASAGMLTTLAGGAAAGFADGFGSGALFSGAIRGLALRSSSGSIYMADTGNAAVRVFAPSNSYVSTLVGGRAGYLDGPSAYALLGAPWGLAFDSTDTLLAADLGNFVVRSVSPAGAVATVAGTAALGGGFANGPATGAAGLMAPRSAFPMPGGAGVVISDFGSLRLLTCPASPSPSAGASASSTPAPTGTPSPTASPSSSVTPSATPTAPPPPCALSALAGSATAGYMDSANASAAMFNVPRGLHYDGGNATRKAALYVAEFNNRIRAVFANGSVVTVAGAGVAGSTDGESASCTFNGPRKAVVDALTGDIIVADTNGNRIRRVSGTTRVCSTVAGSAQGFADGEATAALFNFPVDVLLHPVTRLIYVSDTDNHRVRAISPAATVSTLAGSVSGFLDGIGAAAQFNRPFGSFFLRPRGLRRSVRATNKCLTHTPPTHPPSPPPRQKRIGAVGSS